MSRAVRSGAGRSFAYTTRDSSGPDVVTRSNKNPRFTGALEADDGTRTHDLLHGKEPARGDKGCHERTDGLLMRNRTGRARPEVPPTDAQG